MLKISTLTLTSTLILTNPIEEDAMQFEARNSVEKNWRDAMSSVKEIINVARDGGMFILVDHENRKNEGYLVVPPQMANSDAINFMAQHRRSLICLALLKDQIEVLGLGLPLMVSNNASRHETTFTLTIEARDGVITGISAHDWARTVAVVIDASKTAEDIATPGHVFPLQARKGGVLKRAGQTDAAMDLSRLDGLNASAVICDIMNEDGTMLRLPELVAFAQKHGLKIGTISDLIAYSRCHENLMRIQSQGRILSEFGGEWLLRIYVDEIHGEEYIVLSKGDLSTAAPVFVRMNALDSTVDLVGTGSKGRVAEFSDAMRLIAGEGRGMIVMMRDTAQKMNDTVAGSISKLRQYGLGAQVLSSLGLSKLELMTNFLLPKVVGLKAYELEITSTRKILETA